jgi:hypothetical protein
MASLPYEIVPAPKQHSGLLAVPAPNYESGRGGPTSRVERRSSRHTGKGDDEAEVLCSIIHQEFVSVGWAVILKRVGPASGFRNINYHQDDDRSQYRRSIRGTEYRLGRAGAASLTQWNPSRRILIAQRAF